MNEIVAYLLLIVTIVIVILSYWKGMAIKRESDLLIKKQIFYERIINYFNTALSQKDYTDEKKFNEIYNLSYIYCDDEVILILNKLFYMISQKDVSPTSEFQDIFAELLLILRRDLKINTNLSKIDYKGLF